MYAMLFHLAYQGVSLGAGNHWLPSWIARDLASPDPGIGADSEDREGNQKAHTAAAKSHRKLQLAALFDLFLPSIKQIKMIFGAITIGRLIKLRRSRLRRSY